jgi:hypothetical protein
MYNNVFVTPSLEGMWRQASIGESRSIIVDNRRPSGMSSESWAHYRIISSTTDGMTNLVRRDRKRVQDNEALYCGHDVHTKRNKDSSTRRVL